MLNEETVAQKFVKKGFWLFLFSLLIAPTGYIIRSLMANNLSPNDFGLFYGIMSLIILLSALNDLGGTESLNYFLPKYIIEKNFSKVKYLIWLIFRLQIISSLSIIVIIFLLSDWLAIHHFKDPNASEILKIMSIFFIGSNLIHICTAFFSATQNTKIQKFLDFIRPVFTVLFCIGIIFFEISTLHNFVWAWTGSVILTTILASYLFYKNFYKNFLKNIPLQKYPELKQDFFKYAIPTLISTNAMAVFSQIDAQMVTNILGNHAHGIYNNYVSIIQIPFFVLAPLLAFMFPVFTELQARKQENKIKDLHQTITVILIILAIWIFTFLSTHGKILAEILFGRDYILSGEIVKYSTPFIVFNLLNQLNFYLLAGTGQAWVRTRAFLIALPINIILNFILITHFGIIGAGLAVGLSWIPLYIMSFLGTKQYFKFPPIQPIIINTITAGISMTLFHFGIEKFFPKNIFISLILGTLLFGIIFIVSNFSHFKKTFILIKNNR